MKKGLLVAILILLLVVVPAYAAMSTTITVTETSSNSYDMLGIKASIDNAYLADHGYITASGLDVDISSLPFMLSNDATYVASPLAANTSLLLAYTTGNTPASSFKTVLGQSGYITVPDTAAAELVNNFEIEQKGWVDTASGSDKNLAYKADAFRTYVSAAEEITSKIFDGATFDSSTSDGYIYNEGSTYSTVRTAASGTADSAATTLRLGQSRVGGTGTETLRPDSAGTYTELTPSVGANWECVDEAVVNDGDYVYGSTDTSVKLDSYNLLASSIPAGSYINSVTVYFRVKSNAAGAANSIFTPLLRLGTSDSYGSAVGHQGNAWANYNGAVTRPGGGTWTVSDFANLQAGIRIQKDNTEGGSAMCSQLYIEIDHTYYYRIDRTYVYFDTSPIPDGATVDSATLSLYGDTNESDTDFNITVQSGMPTFPSDPLVAGDYLHTQYAGDGGTFGTASFNAAGWNAVGLNSTGLGWVNKTGYTKFALRSNRDIGDTGPTGDEYVVVQSANGANAPKLEVVYSVSVTVTGISSGERIVKSTANTTNLALAVTNYDNVHQGNSPQSVALSGASVTDNANSWTLIQNNVMPYMEYITIDVSSVEKLKYQPNAIIGGQTYSTGTVTGTSGTPNVTGTTTVWASVMEGGLILISGDSAYYTVSSVTDGTHLVLATNLGSSPSGASYNMHPRMPDLDSTRDGLITFGSNPAGVAASIGALLPDVVLTPGAGTVDIPDLTPEYTPDVSSGVEGANLPLYGFFKALLSDYNDLGGPNITMPYFWKIVAMIISFIVGTAVLVATRNLLVGIGAYAITLAVPTAMGVIDWFYVIWYIIGAIAISLLVTKWSGSSM